MSPRPLTELKAIASQLELLVASSRTDSRPTHKSRPNAGATSPSLETVSVLLDGLEERDRQTVIGLTSEKAVHTLAALTKSSATPSLRALQQSIEGRYSTVCGLSLECDPEWRRIATTVIRGMMLNPEVVDKLQKAEVRIVLRPEHLPLNDLPETARYALTLAENTLGFYATRENLAVTCADNVHMDGSVTPHNLVHELAHAVEFEAFDHETRRALKRLFRRERRSDFISDTYAWDYATKNYHEYFAVAAEAYFGLQNLQVGRDRLWLKEHDPEMYDLMVRVFTDKAPDFDPEGQEALRVTIPKVFCPGVPREPPSEWGEGLREGYAFQLKRLDFEYYRGSIPLEEYREQAERLFKDFSMSHSLSGEHPTEESN